MSRIDEIFAPPDALPLYDQQSKCEKCGGEDVASSYHSRGVYDPPCQDDKKARPGWDEEHIGRYCRRCGYSWAEAVKR